MEITLDSIGMIHTPFKTIENMPIQPAGAAGIKGSIDLYEKFLPGLKDLEGFSHIILLYYFHKVQESQLTVTPFLDAEPHGVFATRAPKRPNPIGLSVVRLQSVYKNILEIENVDMLDGSPLLDIKPYVPDFDGDLSGIRLGWLQERKDAVVTKSSDGRFR
ncbi:MAG: tRNA (N6-threonylcarbamoyladenosine(37)-N6)-methyltransferase TrmO [Anaerolineaceae bacterium]|nr:tRNA (N6-threonylcarbamoyladenosine(37)-N6)-methyltransferase TrmO [Anaerolineaceae bacterium]